jgi:putative colanic acid biosynthesis acetyltransferase WcaF
MALWYLTNAVFFRNPLLPFSFLKIILLRMFGAKIGNGVVIKPAVNIKCPWHLVVGDYVWIGENVWIDNLVKIELQDNSCISQGAMLLTGNHHYKKSTFDLIAKEIIIEEGAWVGAQTVVCPGVILRSHSILTVGSVATKSLDAYGIFTGNPAIKVRERKID